jgi:N-acetylglucosamine kinase-like BadF-type ATPase
MILIADSGSTKVDWRVICRDGSSEAVSTAGINPYFQSEEQILDELRKNLVPFIKTEIKEVYFYGAGVAADKIDVLKNCFNELFPGVVSNAYTDLLAASRALCGNEPGIACIMGTGSNSCFFDGDKIVDNVPACGYILGDEGSGAVLGKKLLSDYLKRQLPLDLSKKFDEQYGLNYGSIVERVYRQPFPNRFLATFTHFLYENRENEHIHNLIKIAFNEFFQRNISQYDFKQYKINLVGSIAYHFSDILREAACENEMTIGKILKSPIEGLEEYHKSIIK